LELCSQLKKGEHELSAGVVEAASFAGDAEGLTWGPANEEVHISSCKGPGVEFGE
jgi:hypothetical protein